MDPDRLDEGLGDVAKTFLAKFKKQLVISSVSNILAILNPCTRKILSEILTELGDDRWEHIISDESVLFDKVGEMVGVDAIPMLINALLSASDKLPIVTALEQLGEPKWRSIIFEHDGSYCEKLGTCGDERLFEYCINIAETIVGDDCDPTSFCTMHAQILAVETLGWMRDVRAVPVLVDTLEFLDAQGYVPRVRSMVAIIRALGRIGFCQCCSSLEKFMFHECEEIRHEAIAALRALGANFSVTSFHKSLTDEAAKQVEGDRAAELQEILDSIPRNEQDRDHDSEYVFSSQKRWNSYAVSKEQSLFAITELSNCGKSEAIEPLLFALCCFSAQLRVRAAEGLEKLGEPQWKSIVRGTNDDWIKLGESGDKRLVDILYHQYMTHVREQEISVALGLLGDCRVIARLVSIACAPRDCALKLAAKSALKCIGISTIVQELLRIFYVSNESHSVCLVAACVDTQSRAYQELLSNANHVDSGTAFFGFGNDNADTISSVLLGSSSSIAMVSIPERMIEELEEVKRLSEMETDMVPDLEM